MADVRCRFCGDVPRSTPTLATDPSRILRNDVQEPCGYNDHHVFVSKDSPGYKRHPFTQYAAELDPRVRACPDCGELTRYGATPKGRWEWFTSTTLRQHWRECDDRSVSALRKGMATSKPRGPSVHRDPGGGPDVI